jgi:protein SCO1/2
MDDPHAGMRYERSAPDLRQIAIGLAVFAGCIGLGLVIAWLALGATGAAKNAPNNATRPDITGPVIGATLPDKTSFRDAEGARVTLDDAIDGRPTLVVLGYLTCRDLCETTTAGMTEALRRAALVPGRDYRALFVSIDPRDGGAPLARALDQRIPVDERDAWRFVSPDGRTIEGFANALGWRFRPEDGGFAHAAGFFVVTPERKVASYFPGVRFDAADLRHAVEDASHETEQTVIDRLVVLCSHFDPLKGRHSADILAALRALAAALAIAAIAALWIASRRSR